MVKMNFHMGVTLRCYGNVEVEAESVEAAFPLLTADYIAEHIDIKETTTDSGQDLAVIDVSDADTGEELAEYGGHSLPSPYDPEPDAALQARVTQLEAALTTVAGKIGSYHDATSDDAEMHIVADIEATVNGALAGTVIAPKAAAEQTANMVQTLEWLAVQFRDRANEDPAQHTEQDAQQVESARKAALDMLAALKRIADYGNGPPGAVLDYVSARQMIEIACIAIGTAEGH